MDLKSSPANTGTERVDWRREDLVFAGLLATAAVLITVRTREVYDDPAILYRYAVNLSHGDGWTFNPGTAQANAVTSPLTVLTLAALLVLRIPLSIAAAAFFAVGMWMSSFFTYRTLVGSDRRRAGLIAGALIVSAPPLLQLRGMETALLLGLLALATYAARVRRWTLLGASLGMAALARPDAILIGAAFALWAMSRGVRWYRFLCALCVPLVLWGIASAALSQNPLPSTLAAKIAQERSGVWQSYLGSLATLPINSGAIDWFAVLLLVATTGSIVSPQRPRIPAPLLPLVTGTIAIVLVYGVVLRIAGYPWYAALPIYLLIVLAALGLDGLACLAPRNAAVAGDAMATGVVTVVLVVGFLNYKGMEPERREYPRVAAWLDKNTPARSTVAAQEIGFLGLTSDRRMIDYLGLLNPDMNDRIRRDDFVSWVGREQPDYWVTYKDARLDVGSRVRSQPWFSSDFTEVYATDHLLVFRRIGRIPQSVR